MKRDLEKIDELIKETLNVEEAQFYDSLEERNLFGKLGEVYKGKMGWLMVVMNLVTLVFLGLFVYCLVQFFETDETNMFIKWALGGFICWSFMAMIKLYIWMQMNRNDVLRELKRIELQLAVLKERNTTAK